jgi:hypothetical protein
VSDPTETPKPETPKAAETPKPEAAPQRAPEPKADDAYAAALKSITAERDSLAAELRARDKKIGELTGERDAFKGQVDGFERAGREGALVERLQRDLPGADRMALRGVLAVLGEAKKIDRFPMAEQLDETAKKAIELIKAEAPSLTRPPPAVGGSNGVPHRQPTTQQTQQRKSLVWGSQ